MNGLNGNDYITSENMDAIKEYLLNNFDDVSVEFEENNDEIVMTLNDSKYKLFPNTKVSDLISSFDQMFKKNSDAGSAVDNNTYYRRNRRSRKTVKDYRIDVNEELYNSLCVELDNISNDVSQATGLYDPSMLSGKLGKFYEGLGVDNDKDTETIKNVVDDLSIKIKYSLELYNNTDKELQYFFNSMVSQVFAYDDFKNGGSVEYVSVEQRSENIKNYIASLSESYDAIYQEYLRLYCNGMNGEGVLLDSDAAELLAGIMRSFHLNSYDIGSYGYTEDNQSYIDINPLAETVAFIKENKVLDKLKKYSDGASWEESGMSELNRYLLGYSDPGLIDSHYENEMTFLIDYFDQQDEKFIEEVSEKYGYKMSNSIFLDEGNEEAISLLKNRIKNQIGTFSLSDTEQLIENKSETQQVVASLAGQIYNLKQYEKMMPYDEIRKDPEFLKYLGKNYNASGEFEWYDQTELAMYHYVYEKDGFDAANKYLKVMEDTVNQRKGFVAAAKYVELLNAGHAVADIANEISPLLGIPAEGIATILNTGISGTDGFVTGLFTFGKGFYNLVHADGVQDVSDYTIMFKAQLMSEANEYNENMEDWQRQLYYHNNQIMSSVGNMAIPCLLSSLGVPALGKAALFLSAMGNETENAMQQGYSGGQSYLYGALSATLELATESLLGSLPGLGSNAPQNLASLKGVQFLKALGMSMFDEGKEEFIQTYAEAGLRYLILGEPLDLSKTTADAAQAFIYGALTSGIMNLGSTIPVKLKNGNVVNLKIDNADDIMGSIDAAESVGDLIKDDIDINDNADISVKYSTATDKSVADIENVINTLMTKYSIDRADAIKRIELAVSSENYNVITREGDARTKVRNYDFTMLKDTLNVIKSMDYASPQAISDVEYAIKQIMNKYEFSRDEALEVFDKLLRTGDYNRITREGDARTIIRKYSLEQLDGIIAKLKMNDLSTSNTSSDLPTESPADSGESNNPPAPPPRKLSPNSLFASLTAKLGSSYGVDQGGIYDLCRYEGPDGKQYSYRQAKALKNEAMKNGQPLPRFKKIGSKGYFEVKNYISEHYGLTETEASVFLSTVDDVGACSYASVANEIFSTFNGDEELFKQKMGFSMYNEKTGKPNYELLLADMYFNVNKVDNGGYFVKFDPATGKHYLNQGALSSQIDPLGRKLLNADSQRYLSGSKGKNLDAINSYLKTKGCTFESETVSTYRDHPVLNYSDMKQRINGDMQNGYVYSLGIYSVGDEIRMISTDGKTSSCSTKNWGEGGGHSVFITDVTQEGLIISSWGNKYVIPFSDLSQSNSLWTLTRDKVNIN
jgi:hypothetical protein